MAKVTYLTKLSIKNLGAVPKGYREWENGKKVAVAHLFGRIDKMTPKPSQFGISNEFSGVFRGVNLESGEVFNASKCFFPGASEDLVASAFDKVAETEGATLEVAMEISVKRNIKKNSEGVEIGIGYEYSVSPLVELSADADPLASLAARVQAALPAPVETVEASPAEAAPADPADPAPAEPKKGRNK